jgi:N-methylhydantoinase A/oxoprolinase/acetone carboxylase beta subunit
VVAGDGSAALSAEREVWFEGGWRSARFYKRELLVPGDAIAGPAMITEYTAAALVLPGCAARVDGLGNLVIEIGQDSVGEEAAA